LVVAGSKTGAGAAVGTVDSVGVTGALDAGVVGVVAGVTVGSSTGSVDVTAAPDAGVVGVMAGGAAREPSGRGVSPAAEQAASHSAINPASPARQSQ
jgi:hypothetical protein